MWWKLSQSINSVTIFFTANLPIFYYPTKSLLKSNYPQKILTKISYPQNPEIMNFNPPPKILRTSLRTSPSVGHLKSRVPPGFCMICPMSVEARSSLSNKWSVNFHVLASQEFRVIESCGAHIILEFGRRTHFKFM